MLLVLNLSRAERIFFDLKLRNCTHKKDKGKGVIFVECCNCGNVSEIDLSMTGYVDIDDAILTSDERKVFIKTMPKGIANIPVDFDIKIEKDKVNGFKSNLTLLGENETHCFLHKKARGYIKAHKYKL